MNLLNSTSQCTQKEATVRSFQALDLSYCKKICTSFQCCLQKKAPKKPSLFQFFPATLDYLFALLRYLFCPCYFLLANCLCGCTENQKPATGKGTPLTFYKPHWLSKAVEKNSLREPKSARIRPLETAHQQSHSSKRGHIRSQQKYTL